MNGYTNQNRVQNTQGQVLYKLAQKKSRVIIPHFLTLIILSALFYVGILINLSLLKLKGSQESTITTVALFVITLLILLGTLLKYTKVKRNYLFLAHKIIISKKKSVVYNNILGLTKKRGILDKIFGTYTLVLTHDAKLENIPVAIDIENYVLQLIEFNKQQATQVY